jgi:hypothetical protein
MRFQKSRTFHRSRRLVNKAVQQGARRYEYVPHVVRAGVMVNRQYLEVKPTRAFSTAY